LTFEPEEMRMRITVEYAAQVKRAAGAASETVEMDGPAPVREVLSRVAQRHGSALRELLLDAEGQPRPSILLFVGDRQVRGDDPTRLDGSEPLTIIPPISGG
jgi:molybdopterin converting factor small subunit